MVGMRQKEVGIQRGRGESASRAAPLEAPRCRDHAPGVEPRHHDTASHWCLQGVAALQTPSTLPLTLGRLLGGNESSHRCRL